MGARIVDAWTVGHFLFGIISTMSILPSKVIYSILIGNVLHGINELFIEKDFVKGTNIQLESMPNHIGDMAAFLVGSLLGIFLTKYTLKYPALRWGLLIVLILVGINEIMRELFPRTWPFDPAYHNYLSYCNSCGKSIANGSKKCQECLDKENSSGLASPRSPGI